MNELFESLDIDNETKQSLQEAFDKAVVKKTTELMEDHVETQVNEAKELLEAEFAEKVENLEDTLDGYLSSVVEEFVAENAPSYEAQITEEKTKTLLEMFDAMLTVAGVTMTEISEAKEVRDQAEIEASAEYRAEKLDEKVSELVEEVIEAKREADKFLKAGIMAECKADLTMIEGDKFDKLAEMVPFERTESYVANLEMIAESIIENRTAEFNESAAAQLPLNAFAKKEVSTVDAMDYSKYI